MNEVEWLKSLDRESADAPRIDVTANVIRTVCSIQQEDETVFSIAAVFAVVAGAAAIALAMPAWAATQDPLAGFTDAFDLVLR